MKYDFTTVIDRAGRDSIAADVIPFEGLSVDEGFDPIPMWIADMSFPVAPAVISAIKSRLDFPSFGYFPLSREYFDSISAAATEWRACCRSISAMKTASSAA